MSEYKSGLMILATISGWALLALILKDIFINARLAFAVNNEREKARLYYNSSGSWILSTALKTIKVSKWRRFFLRQVDFIIPLFQFLIWKIMLVSGFGFLYFALDLQAGTDESIDSFFADLISAFGLSLAISIRFAPYDLPASETGIFLLGNFQFYLGFVFYGFILTYFLVLRRRAKKLQPFLYRLKNEIEISYSPFNFSNSLKRYGSKELLLILQDWEIWAERSKNNLKSSPLLIYRRSRSEDWSWLSSANLILDTTAAVIVTSDGAIRQQAGQTFASVYRTVTEISAYLRLNAKTIRLSACNDCRVTTPDNDEDILSAEIVYDKSREDFETEMNENFLVWQFTYQSHLNALAEHLEVRLPSRQN